MSKVLIYSQEDLDLILELEKEENEELQQENKKLNDAIQTYDILLKANVEENKQLKEEYNKIQKAYESTFSYYQQLKDNWIKLKEWIKVRDNIGLEKICLEDIVYEIIELEQGSDSNE